MGYKAEGLFWSRVPTAVGLSLKSEPRQTFGLGHVGLILPTAQEALTKVQTDLTRRQSWCCRAAHFVNNLLSKLLEHTSLFSVVFSPCVKH